LFPKKIYTVDSSHAFSVTDLSRSKKILAGYPPATHTAHTGISDSYTRRSVASKGYHLVGTTDLTICKCIRFRWKVSDVNHVVCRREKEKIKFKTILFVCNFFPLSLLLPQPTYYNSCIRLWSFLRVSVLIVLFSFLICSFSFNPYLPLSLIIYIFFSFFSYSVSLSSSLLSSLSIPFSSSSSSSMSWSLRMFESDVEDAPLDRYWA
jgi:hypothetical protein